MLDKHHDPHVLASQFRLFREQIKNTHDDFRRGSKAHLEVQKLMSAAKFIAALMFRSGTIDDVNQFMSECSFTSFQITQK